MSKIYLFRADVAAYCDEAQEVLEEIRKEYPGKTTLQIFDVERDRGITRKFGVTKVPTIIVDETVRFTGVPPKDELLHLIETKRRRIPTGIGFVDAMTRGGMGRGDTVLIEGDVGAGKTSFCVQVAAKVLNEGMNAVYVCTNETPDEVREKLSMLDDARTARKLSMVDLYSWRMGEIYRSDEAFTTESITDLPKLLAVIDSATKEGNAGQTVLFLDSVSELLLHNEIEEVVYFWEKLSARLKINRATGVFVLEDIHPPNYIETMRFLANEIYELRLDRDDDLRRKFRVYKTRLGDHAKHWVLYQITGRGLVTEEPFR
jgi:KaiC/GvpD/RAD55 family RecA-like ATPase